MIADEIAVCLMSSRLEVSVVLYTVNLQASYLNNMISEDHDIRTSGIDKSQTLIIPRILLHEVRKMPYQLHRPAATEL